MFNLLKVHICGLYMSIDRGLRLMAQQHIYIHICISKYNKDAS